MSRYIRVIPTLLLKSGGLVKGVRFKNHVYVGDPINVVKIFNEKEVDEIIILDIDKNKGSNEPDYEIISDIASEAFIPVGYGGGITSIEQIKKIFQAGVEKVVLNTALHTNKQLVAEAVAIYGSQSIVGSIDVKKNFWGKYEVWIQSGTVNTHIEPIEYARQLEQSGIGELIIQNIDKDGTFSGYDLDLILKVSNSINIPTVAGCGARDVNDLRKAVEEGGASAATAGSMFVFHGTHKAVLINFPPHAALKV